MKRIVQFGLGIVILFLCAAAFADAPDLTGVWKTEKGAEVTCDTTTCTLTKQTDDPSGNKPLGTTVLKDFAVNDKGEGTAMHVHPLREDAYLDVNAALNGDSLTLTFRIKSLESSSIWTRVDSSGVSE